MKYNEIKLKLKIQSKVGTLKFKLSASRIEYIFNLNFIQ